MSINFGDIVDQSAQSDGGTQQLETPKLTPNSTTIKAEIKPGPGSDIARKMGAGSEIPGIGHSVTGQPGDVAKVSSIIIDVPPPQLTPGAFIEKPIEKQEASNSSSLQPNEGQRVDTNKSQPIVEQPVDTHHEDNPRHPWDQHHHHHHHHHDKSHHPGGIIYPGNLDYEGGDVKPTPTFDQGTSKGAQGNPHSDAKSSLKPKEETSETGTSASQKGTGRMEMNPSEDSKTPHPQSTPTQERNTRSDGRSPTPEESKQTTSRGENRESGASPKENRAPAQQNTTDSRSNDYNKGNSPVFNQNQDQGPAERVSDQDSKPFIQKAENQQPSALPKDAKSDVTPYTDKAVLSSQKAGNTETSETNNKSLTHRKVTNTKILLSNLVSNTANKPSTHFKTDLSVFKELLKAAPNPTPNPTKNLSLENLATLYKAYSGERAALLNLILNEAIALKIPITSMSIKQYMLMSDLLGSKDFSAQQFEKLLEIKDFKEFLKENHIFLHFLPKNLKEKFINEHLQEFKGKQPNSLSDGEIKEFRKYGSYNITEKTEKTWMWDALIFNHLTSIQDLINLSELNKHQPLKGLGECIAKLDLNHIICIDFFNSANGSKENQSRIKTWKELIPPTSATQVQYFIESVENLPQKWKSILGKEVEPGKTLIITNSLKVLWLTQLPMKEMGDLFAEKGMHLITLEEGIDTTSSSSGFNFLKELNEKLDQSLNPPSNPPLFQGE
ncbi:MAG: hypothetical protein A2007_02050 [Verrucomicrobia bacterium GWC2_42_7]|nr:MAG: hypothetical protein A2007_02050 [Verrucomicrobia bacterium GWC2_42_7]